MNTLHNESTQQHDYTTAFVAFKTSDSFFIETEEKNATGFTYSIGHKLSQVLNVPWTRFGVFLTVYNKTDRTVEDGVANACLPDEVTAEIECKVVEHGPPPESGILRGTLLQTFMSEHLSDASAQKSAWRPSELKFETIIVPATFKNGDNLTAEDVAYRLVAAAQDHDDRAPAFHMLFPSTMAALGSSPFEPGPWGGQSQNSVTIGFNPSGHRSGPLREPSEPKIETALDIATEAQNITADTNKRLADLDSALGRSAMAHYDALRFTPYLPPTVAPSGALMYHEPQYPPGPD
jgi:hypothetical protein